MERERARRMTTESQATDAAEAPAAAAAREPDWSEWAGPDGELGLAIQAANRETLASYRVKPTLIQEHANQEHDLARGGYADRQVIELTQNSADSSIGNGDGRIEVVLTRDRFYFADDGTAVSEEGVRSLLHTHLSPKRGDDLIGRFGLGFKSLLRISNQIEFISKSCSFRFDEKWATEELNLALENRNIDRIPVMRLAQPFDPRSEIETDSIARRLATNYVNFIRVHLNQDAAFRISNQLFNFPAEFIMLVDHVTSITLNNRTRDELTTIKVDRSADAMQLIRDGQHSAWHRFTDLHRLTDRAIQDRRTMDDSDAVKLTWVVPERARGERGKFWAYFPTQMDSLLAGILNAPWKTNEDRTNLIAGDFNDELIDASAALVAGSIASLRSEADPARHLDALPPREEAGRQDHAWNLRRGIFRRLNQSEIVPDRDGVLRKPSDIHYPPEAILPATTTSALDLYAQSPYAPPNSLHVSATSRDRWVRVEELNDPTGRRKRSGGEGARHPSFGKWLEALTSGKSGQDAVAASRDAIQVAALLQESLRSDPGILGRIVLTKNHRWRSPDGVYLPSQSGARFGDADKLIHDGLAEDPETLLALKMLGVKELSSTERFRDALKLYLGRNRNPYTADSDDCEELWRAVSDTDWQAVVDLVKEIPDYRSKIPVLVANGTWKPLKHVIWPGRLCSVEEAPDVCVDAEFHSDADEDILESLGVRPEPRSDFDVTQEDGYQNYAGKIVGLYRRMRHPSGQTPQHSLLRMQHPKSPGPVHVLNRLPDEPRTRYTKTLLESDSLFRPCTVKHATQLQYKPHNYPNYSLHFVRQHGVVSDGQGGVVRLVDAGEHPSALRELAELPTWDKIKEAFGFDDPPATVDDCEAVEPEDEELIIDAWPGLQSKIRAEDHALEVVRCSGIAVRGVLDPTRLYFADDPRAYVVRSDDRQELESVNDALGLKLSASDISKVLEYEDRQVEARRRQVRECATDAERLLAAVGEANLRAGLPATLVAYKERNGPILAGIPLAEAAIATYDSGTLKHYRQNLAGLNPPNQWAGGPRTVGFVRSLGFPEDWAGTRNQRRDAFVEVDGPFMLKPLHDYQERVAERIVDMLQPQSFGRRGMLSLPTGAGKTRVAVEGTVRAMLEHRSMKAVLWVADRDELCEQAVQSWIQVWRCFGAEGTQLRVSRMWEGQPPPESNNQMHVIVASIQTLNAKLRNNVRAYDFIKDVDLVIFDEAHRSIAPSFTHALTEIGFTPRQGMTEPYLMGLTATPYRGHNDAETRWLVNRYGRNRLDDGAFPDDVIDPQDVVEHLQGKGILARARHEEIEGGRFSLSWEELAEIRRTNLLSRTAEDKIARDTARTERIIEAYDQYVRSVEPDAPTIIFATSVEHAMTLAAELSGQGVVARAVSGGTDRGTRRRIVEEFKRKDGEIKVLVNYGVFREGFDAPLTKVIIVARPVWSPNLYFQMIGRGLRGPANGGNNESLIINVRDNIENYERKLAFTEVDWLWD